MESIQKRNIGVCILLAIVTCGLYAIYWLYSIIKDVCVLRGKENTAGMDILLTIVTCGLYSIYLMYRIGSDIDYIKAERNIPSNSNSILLLLLSVFGLSIISYALAQNAINELS